VLQTRAREVSELLMPEGTLSLGSGGRILVFQASCKFTTEVLTRTLDQIFCLPVPEKTKRQHNFVAIPYNAHGLVPIAPGAPEPIIWTAFEPGPKDTEAPREPQHTADLLQKQLKPFGKSVVFPDEDEFASAIVQSHRKGEVAFHVKAHRGSKDGKAVHPIVRAGIKCGH
jgi:hypothetical protein